MPYTFDPYHQWLGIPQDEQPPHYYRLLAVRLFESDPNVIDNAADRITMHLRSLSLGPNGALAQRILNEVAAARVCLLNPEQRSQYDNRLAAYLRPPHVAVSAPSPPIMALPAAPRPIPVTPQPAQTPLTPAIATASRPLTGLSGSRRRSPSPSKTAYEIIKVIAGGLLGLVIAQAVLFYALGVDIFGIMGRLHPNRRVDPPAVASRASAVDAKLPTTKAPAPQAQFPLPQPLSAPAPPNPPPPIPPSSPTPLPSPPVPPSGPTVISPEINGESQLRPADALAKLPRGVELPPQIETTSRKLVPLKVADVPDLELTSSIAAIPKDAAFVLERVQTRPEWLLCYCPNIAENSQATQEIARLYAKDDGLWYQWGEPLADKQIRPQVRNCRLSVKFGSESKSLALRETKQNAPLVIDLSKPLCVQELELSDLPSEKALAIQFGDLGRFSRGAIWKNDISSAALGKTAIIEFSQVAGARLKLSLTKKSGGILAVTIRPVFLEQDQEREMTLARLAQMENLPQQIAKDQVALAAYQDQHSSLRQDLTAVRGTPFQVNVQKTKIQSDIKRVSSRIATLNRQIAQNTARNNNLPEMRSFLNELHQKTIDFTVEAGQGVDRSVLTSSAP